MAAPIPVILLLTVAIVVKVPVIPKEVIVAKVLPAVTAPIELCIAAAALPAAIPAVPKPNTIGINPPDAIILLRP